MSEIQLDHTKLYVSNLPRGLSEDGLKAALSKYGHVEHCSISKNPDKFALVTFETAAEARIAMMKLNKVAPLNLTLNIAHKNHNNSNTNYDNQRNSEDISSERKHKENKHRDCTGSVKSSKKSRNNNEQTGLDDFESQLAEEMGVDIDHSLHLQLEQMKLEQLRVKEEQLRIKQKILVLQQHDKHKETSCQRLWKQDTGGNSTPSTCVVCSDEESDCTVSKGITPEKSDTTNSKTFSNRHTESKSTDITVSKGDYTSEYSKTDGSKRSEDRAKKCEVRKCACNVRSDATCDIKFRDFYCQGEDEADETNRLIQLRNTDYLDVVDDEFKVVLALAGYPKSKMRLRQMELFQRCLSDVINMQLKANLLKKVPSFFDYYLNRGAIVCVCKDLDTRDWMVRIAPGLQERMSTNLVLFTAKIKRLGLAMLKIPQENWPASAQDCFKLLQYFNPSLKTETWRIYSQKVIDDVECISFLMDRVSTEIIRGPTFKNVIDYEQVEFELTGFTEIYYECLLSGLDEDLNSVASRVKLLEEIKSANSTPRIASTVSVESTERKTIKVEEIIDNPFTQSTIIQYDDATQYDKEDTIDEPEMKDGVLDVDTKNISRTDQCMDEVLVWADENNEPSIQAESEVKRVDSIEINTTTTSLVAMSEKSESVIESVDNLIIKNSAINIDSNKGISYHRRTNYLHVENELKVAVTLEGYPQNKLEGTHIRRLKHLFKECLHKDMKSQRFANLIVPKFQDVYLSNGAVIYICDSMETRDYLAEVLPKFINTTGLKLTFRDVKNLVRYTRIVMRLPKEKAHCESVDILYKLEEKYPGLKPDYWKYYSDVAGKQKRQFGVDPESLEVIKSPDFNPVFEGEPILFRIIDRQKRDTSCEESIKNIASENVQNKRHRQAVVKNMYVPIDQDITNAPLTRIRTNHYSDLIADDLKLYVGPTNYPDLRIDEAQFHSIKRTFENIVLESLENREISEESIPKFHDLYLFDGVIFIICQSMNDRVWIEENVAKVNETLKVNLKCTEFRGAVGIISMVVKTDKETDDVIDILQKQNTRLRTKYWRKISTVKTGRKLDVVLQIDKLSAEVIADPSFNNLVGKEAVQFRLGHLQSLIKPQSSLEEIMKARVQKHNVKPNNLQDDKMDRNIVIGDKDKEFEKDIESDNDSMESPKLKQDQTQKEHSLETYIIHPETTKNPELSEGYQSKVILKIPLNILPESEDDLSIIFDILEDKNPGLNTEIWQVFTETAYPCNGKFILYVDKQSMAVIKNKDFDSSVGGEKLKFYF